MANTVLSTLLKKFTIGSLTDSGHLEFSESDNVWCIIVMESSAEHHQTQCLGAGSADLIAWDSENDYVEFCEVLKGKFWSCDCKSQNRRKELI